MALTNEQKQQILSSLINSIDGDVYRQQVELEALTSEEAAVGDDQKPGVQQAIANTEANLARLQARQSTWQRLYDAL